MVRPFTISLFLVTLLVGAISGFAVAGIEPTDSLAQIENSVDANQKNQQFEELPLYTDQLFLQEMIDSHEAAVTKSKQVLAHTSRKEVRQLAGEIIEFHAKQSEQMKNWLSQWE